MSVNNYECHVVRQNAVDHTVIEHAVRKYLPWGDSSRFLTMIPSEDIDLRMELVVIDVDDIVTILVETKTTNLTVVWRMGHSAVMAAIPKNTFTAQDIAHAVRNIPLVIKKCPLTEELYGYAAPLLDEEGTIRNFSAALGRRLSFEEEELAKQVACERFGVYLETGK